ncbi:hypothetical protein EBX31_01870 [bacterium]|nr:hypothetical protein [bacterium]
MNRDDQVSARKAAERLSITLQHFRNLAAELQFERERVSPRRVMYSWTDILERLSLASGRKAEVKNPSRAVFVDQKEASRRLGIAINTFRHHAARTGLLRYSIGKRGVRYRLDEVVEKLAQAQY